MTAVGAITEGIDVVDLLVAAFALFFVGLVIFLRREDKREGYAVLYPSINRRRGVIGWPAPPSPKTYKLMSGDTVQVPHDRREPSGLAAATRNGAPAILTGDPLLSQLGAAASVWRSEEPMRTLDQRVLLMPLRNATDWRVRPGEDDPRGMRILARDFRPVGRVIDLWVDRAAMILRYLEVVLDDNPAPLLLPIFYCDINRREREIRVTVLKVGQFEFVPRLATGDLMTAREEDRINAFYAGGTIYSDPWWTA